MISKGAYDVSNQDEKKSEGMVLAGQLAGVLAGIVAIFLAITTFLTFLSNECERGAPFMSEVFVCFPAR
jgi:hypothetical protein